MDIGFSRRAQQLRLLPLDQLNYASLLAELAAAQAESATARAQSLLGPSRNGADSLSEETPEVASFHASTAAFLRNKKE